MAALVSVRLEGGAKLRAALSRLDPADNARIFSLSAREIATKIAANARNVQIRRGGGGVHPTQLTSRTFRLRDSIAPDFRGLPRFAEVGTDVLYGGVHEFGLGRMPARPFMVPALEDVRPEIPAIIVKHWKRAGGL